MTTLMEPISFCDRKANNIRSDDLKETILNQIQEKYQFDISFKPYNILKSTRLACVDKHPHFLSLRTVGNSYFLYLTTIEDIKYCFYIDRKIDAPRHIYPRIVSVNYQFDESLYQDTLLDGELICDVEKRWYFILTDVLVYKGQLLEKQPIERRMELMYYIMLNDYTPNMIDDICPFQIKKLFTYSEIDYMLTNFIPNLPYNVKGICFNTLNPQYSSYIYMFNQMERIPNKYRQEMKNQKREFKHQTRNLDKKQNKTHTFKIVKANTSQIYNLYCFMKGKLAKYGAAYIGDVAHQEMIACFFKTTESELDVLVQCYYVPRFKKWKPIQLSNKKKPDEYDLIRKTINSYDIQKK